MAVSVSDLGPGRARPVDVGEDRPTPAGGTDSYRYMRVLLFLMLVVILDFTKGLDRGSAVRYLILLVPLGAVVWIRTRHRGPEIRKPSIGDKVLVLLFLFGGVGSVAGRALLDTKTTALPIFIPMTMALLYLLMIEDPTEREARKILVGLALLGTLYVFLNAVANAGIAPSLAASRTYRNADVMYIALGFASAMLAGRTINTFVIAFLASIVFVTYPSATSALVILTTLLTFFVTRPRGTKARFYGAAILAVILGVLLLFNFSSTIRLASDYFSVVGKKDNSTARLALWEGGLRRFAASPLIGDGFSGETTILVFRQEFRGAPFSNPYNNDYILFLASGGIVGFTLLVAWIVWVERTALDRYRALLRARRLQRARLMRALLVGFNGWLIAAAFNPLFSGVSRSITLYSLYGLIMMTGGVGRPRAPRRRTRRPIAAPAYRPEMVSSPAGGLAERPT